DFPTDDSSYGFDTIGSVLSISPVLMEKYLAAAERIAAIAVAADPLPKPFTFEAHTSDRSLRRVDGATAETSRRLDADADYSFQVRLAGIRPPDAKPLVLGIWLDGQLLRTFPVENLPPVVSDTPAGQRAGQASPDAKRTISYYDDKTGKFHFVVEQEFNTERLFVPAGDHLVRAGFVDDAYGKGLSRQDRFDNKKNKVIETIAVTGPFPTRAARPARQKVFVCDPRTGTACVQRILTTLAHRAYRRPVTGGEVAALMKFVRLARSQGQTPEQGLQLAVQAMLMSPNFLFRIERDPEASGVGAIHQISTLELASRLSYFLWSSMPDDALLHAAESGALRTPEVLHAQVKRMLADPKAAALAENFAGQWLEIRNLDVVKPDPDKFPDWSPELRDAMKTETRMFFEYVLREDRPLSDFLDARYTFLNEPLAKHYGITGVTGLDFRKVDLATPERGGILSQGSVLTVSSYPTRTSVVLRGKYVLENILGTPPPPPPPNVPPLDESAVGTAASLRQQMEKHRASPVCASCHSKMDPLGFGLENYDGIGKWRTMDGKFAVDASGTLPNGRSFSTPREMRGILMADVPNFARCISEKMLTYALGRGLEPFDRRAIKEIGLGLAKADYRFQALVYGIVDSVPFQLRHGEPVSTASLGTRGDTRRGDAAPGERSAERSAKRSAKR
ncbi:MAG: DUF1592 domain-containing protein, partial [Acidobacteriota bacterium]